MHNAPRTCFPYYWGWIFLLLSSLPHIFWLHSLLAELHWLQTLAVILRARVMHESVDLNLPGFHEINLKLKQTPVGIRKKYLFIPSFREVHPPGFPVRLIVGELLMEKCSSSLQEYQDWGFDKRELWKRAFLTHFCRISYASCWMLQVSGAQNKN